MGRKWMGFPTSAAFKSAMTLAVVAGSALLAPAATPSLQAVWVYSVSGLPDPVTDAPTMNMLMQSSVASNVNMLYVSVYSSTPNSENRYLVNEQAIATFIQTAHSHGIQVYNAMGDPDWPTKGCATMQSAYQRFADTAAYDSANPSAKFDGIMLDVEPGSSPDFPSLLSLYQCFQQQAASSGLGLAAAINAFWNTSVTFNGVTEAAYQQIVDLKMTSLVVMGYRNSAGTLDCAQGDGVLCLDQAIIEYANSTGLASRILVGLDSDNPATSGSTADETFYSLGQSAMDAAAQSVYSQLAAASLTFGGFSIHNYRDSYLSGTVPGWPLTNPGLLGAPAFFSGEQTVTSVWNYLQFPNGNLFGYYAFTQGSAGTASAYLYHADLGYEFVTQGSVPGSVYFYDFASGHWWYTTSALFPYLYDFSLNTWIYYFPNTQSPGHYTANPRYFSDLTTGQILTM